MKAMKTEHAKKITPKATGPASRTCRSLMFIMLRNCASRKMLPVVRSNLIMMMDMGQLYPNPSCGVSGLLQSPVHAHHAIDPNSLPDTSNPPFR